jgi:hypothetical protein
VTLVGLKQGEQRLQAVKGTLLLLHREEMEEARL